MNSVLPLVSILMIVRNRVEYVHESLNSLIKQTYPALEIIIVDGQSMDGTWELLQKYSTQYEFIRIARQNGLGIGAARNQALSMANGEFLAIADSDDIFHKAKIELQVAYLRDNPNVGVCGTWIMIFGGKVKRIVKYPVQDSVLRLNMFFNSPLANSTVLMRREFFVSGNLQYRLDSCEDYDLWVRLAEKTHFGMIPRVLVLYREHVGQDSQSLGIKSVVEHNTRSIQRHLFDRIHLVVNERELDIHQWLCDLRQLEPAPLLSEIQDWLLKLRDFNQSERVWNEGELFEISSYLWFQSWRRLFGWRNIREYKSSIFSQTGGNIIRNIFRSYRTHISESILTRLYRITF